MESYILVIIILYILIVIVLIVRRRSVKNTFSQLNTLFVKNMDDLYYQISLIIYNHHKDIHNFSSNIPLLLQYKSQELEKKDKANYYSHYNKLIQEIDYIAELTQTPLNYERRSLDQQSTLLVKLHQLKSNLYGTIKIMTLGIITLF